MTKYSFVAEVTFKTIFDSNDFNFDKTVSYKQWVSTDRTTLVTLESAVNEFIDILTDKISELCHYHFMEEQQAAYLKEAKATLGNETCIILTDFAENYSFLVQDDYKASIGTINKPHFISLQCNTMLMMVNLNVTVIVQCQIIYYLLHDQTAVHCFISLVIPTI